MRAIFFDQAEAEAAAERLQREGHSAQVSREWFAGEDDDEDHAWAVVTDAPAAVVAPLIEAYDGWLDGGEPAATPPDPLELPTSPRRHHRPRGD